MTLAEKAAKMARPATEPGAKPLAAHPDPVQGAPAEPLPDIDIPVPEGGPEQVPVHVAWSRVMDDIGKITKSEEYNAPGTKFNFRGVDRTVNAFAPVVRKHGVLVLPVGVDASHRDTRTSKGNATRECTVTVTWMIVGPMGDALPSTLQSAGEALDPSDKGTAKAQSVALRVLLLTGGMVPTGDPDPDSAYIERGEAAVRPARDYIDEIADPRTSLSRLRQIQYELRQTGQDGVIVTNEVGDEEPIGAMVKRIGNERLGKGGGA